MAEKKRTPEDVSTDIQNLNEVYDDKIQERLDKIEALKAEIQELNKEYSDRITELNKEWLILMKETGQLIKVTPPTP